MAKKYLISADDVPTTMMERIQNEGLKPVKFIVETKGFFGQKIVKEKIVMVAWNWNPKTIEKGREIVFPK